MERFFRNIIVTVKHMLLRKVKHTTGDTAKTKTYRSQPTVHRRSGNDVIRITSRRQRMKAETKKAGFKSVMLNWRVAAGAGVLVLLALALVLTLPAGNEQALAKDIAYDGSLPADDDALALSAEDSARLAMEQAGIGGVAMDAVITPSAEFQPETTTPPIATTPPDEADLVPGTRDARIIPIQERLMELGYMGEDEPTDYYGSGTQYAVQLFQRKHNLQVDGLLGEQTISKLVSDDALAYTVKHGDRGTDVISIQERLQELKYLKANATGYFGTDTETAIKRFQTRNGLKSDGSVGENTFEVLYSENARSERVSTSSGSSSSGSSSSGSSGSSSGSSGSGEKSVGNRPVIIGDPDQASADRLIEVAKQYLGVRYRKAGKSPEVGFDCSGFVYWSLNEAGYKIKYMTSSGWASSGYPESKTFTDAKKGDILCFKGHVGIYMGDGKMIDASSGEGKIRIASNIFNSAYWTRSFRCIKRVF